MLGTFHMANPGADMVNADVDDVLAPKRQREIEAVVAALERFLPTKVLVERPKDDPLIADAYGSFCAGERALSRSEVEQLGFRVARAAGHDRIYPVDVIDTFYDERVEELRKDAAHAASWQALLAEGESAVRREEAALRLGTVGDALLVANQPEQVDAMLRPYLNFLLPMAEGDNWAGPDMVANWYRRNFRIAASVHAIAEPGDRLLIIFGSGHIPVLCHALGLSSRFEIHDVLGYLGHS